MACSERLQGLESIKPRVGICEHDCERRLKPIQLTCLTTFINWYKQHRIGTSQTIPVTVAERKDTGPETAYKEGTELQHL